MPTPTYDLLQETTITSAVSTVTFSSIPGTYKDLVVELVGVGSAVDNVVMNLNNDTSALYSRTLMQGNGTSATSFRSTGLTALFGLAIFTTQTCAYAQIMSYANTNVFKTTLFRNNNAGDSTNASVGLWRSTAAVTSIVIGTASISSGSLRLWGVSG